MFNILFWVKFALFKTNTEGNCSWLSSFISLVSSTIHDVLLKILNLLISRTLNFPSVSCLYVCKALDSSLCLSCLLLETQIWDPLENHWSHKWKQLHLHRPDTTSIQWEMGVSSRQIKTRSVLGHWRPTRSHMTAFWIMNIKFF